MANNPGRDMQEEFLNAVRKSEETVIDAIKSWVETVQSMTQKIPSVQVPGADQRLSDEQKAALIAVYRSMLGSTTGLKETAASLKETATALKETALEET